MRSLGLEKTVIFLGWRNDTVDIINALDLFVLPSVHEGMPTVLLEAMSLSIPVVASATGGITELVSDAWNGLLVTPGSDSILAEKCLSIISDSSLISTLVWNAKQRVRMYHSCETVSCLLTLYQRLVNGNCTALEV